MIDNVLLLKKYVKESESAAVLCLAKCLLFGSEYSSQISHYWSQDSYHLQVSRLQLLLDDSLPIIYTEENILQLLTMPDLYEIHQLLLDSAHVKQS